MMSPRTDRFAFSLVLLLTLLACKGDGQQDISPQMDQVSQDQSAAQGVVSETLGERQRGLMFTESLPADEGMLFVFEREQILSFWMKNTPLPLSVAFIDRKGRIVEIRRMEPLDEDTLHTSRRPAMYALEMNAGWFQEHQVKVGDSVEF
jgi:uncharacterized membrane protein (UPF0127 family)